MSEQSNNEVQDLVNTAEEIEEAKAEVIRQMEQEEEVSKLNTPWYIKVRNFFCRIVKVIVQIACTYLKAEVLYILNNPANQTLAKIAVRTAWELGLKSNQAWAAAWQVLINGDVYIADGKCVKGREVHTNILETLLQLIYTCLTSSNQKSVLKA